MSRLSMKSCHPRCWTILNKNWPVPIIMFEPLGLSTIRTISHHKPMSTILSLSSNTKGAFHHREPSSTIIDVIKLDNNEGKLETLGVNHLITTTTDNHELVSRCILSSSAHAAFSAVRSSRHRLLLLTIGSRWRSRRIALRQSGSLEMVTSNLDVVLSVGYDGKQPIWKNGK